MSEKRGIIPAIKYGHMAAPVLLFPLERNDKGEAIAFKKNDKERGKLLTLKHQWNATNRARVERKEYIINERLCF